MFLEWSLPQNEGTELETISGIYKYPFVGILTPSNNPVANSTMVLTSGEGDPPEFRLDDSCSYKIICYAFSKIVKSKETISITMISQFRLPGGVSSCEHSSSFRLRPRGRSMIWIQSPFLNSN